MHNRLTFSLRRLAALFLAVAGPAFAQLPVVPGEPAQPPKTLRPAPELRLQAQVEAQPRLRAQARLSPVTAGELAALRQANAVQGVREDRDVE